jgi:hypothetical protein
LGNTHLEVSGFADACASIFGVSRQSALLLGATLVAGVAGRTLLMPGSGNASIAWHVACIDGADGHAARLCHELLRPVEAAVAKILGNAGDAGSRQTLTQREIMTTNALEKVRQKLQQLQDAVTAGRQALPPLPPSVSAAEIHENRLPLLHEQRRLQIELGRIRLLKRQQMFCGLIGESEVKDRREHGFDGALMEIVMGASPAERLATTGRRVLEAVRAWRDPAPVPRTLLCQAGRMGCSPLLTSIWITGEHGLRDVAGSPRLATLRLLDPFLLIEAGDGPTGKTMTSKLWDGWCVAMAGVFQDRLIDRRHRFVQDDPASKVFANWPRFLADRALSETLDTNPAVHRLPLQLAAVFRRLGDAHHVVQHTITAQDMEMAMGVAETVLKSTAAIRRRLRRATMHLVNATDEEIDGILVKLARLGPSTLRTLARTYHRITKKDLAARLDKAVGAGLVIETPDGLWRLRSHLAAECQPVSASATSQP